MIIIAYNKTRNLKTTDKSCILYYEHDKCVEWM